MVFASELVRVIKAAVKVRKAIMQEIVSCELELWMVEGGARFLEQEMTLQAGPSDAKQVKGVGVSECLMVLGTSRFGLRIASGTSPKPIICPGVFLTSDLVVLKGV